MSLKERAAVPEEHGGRGNGTKRFLYYSSLLLQTCYN